MSEKKGSVRVAKTFQVPLEPTSGGTGTSSYSTGDMIYSDSSNSLSKLSGNTTTTKKFISQTGSGSASAAPEWSTVSKSDVGLGSVENTALSTWAGTTNLTTAGNLSATSALINSYTAPSSAGTWIEYGRTGSYSSFACQDGGGLGGFEFLLYNSSNSLQKTLMSINSTGAFSTYAGILSNGTLDSIGDFSVGGTKYVVTASSGNAVSAGTSKAASFILSGSTSGTVTLSSPAVSGSNTITLPAGTTDFSATGGTSQFVKQNTSGGAFTVAQVGTSDLSGLGTGVSTFLGTPSSANLKSAITDETGSGALVFATSPTLVTPLLGTPTSGTLTSCTGLPISTGVSGLGTGVATFLATPSSSNLASAVTDETGSGSLVFGTSPSFTTSVTTGSTTFSVFNATATTINAFGAATTGNIGYSSTDNSTTNISTGATASGKSNTINIGTGAASGSTTNVRIGSVAGTSLVTANGSLFVGINGSGYVPTAYGTAGVNICWNKSGNATGATYIQNFRQGGSGGFYFELYDLNASLIGSPFSIQPDEAAVFSNKIVSTSSTAGIGYGTGAGGTVTQATSKTTSVTINKITGIITMNNASLSASTTAIFSVNNSTVSAGDTVIATSQGGLSADYRATAFAVTSGAFKISITNLGTTQSEAVLINFTVLKGAAS
jgi:hypothetical protein